MSAWDLPKSALIGGVEYDIRSDYRAVLDVLTVLEDIELSDAERGAIAFEIFYPGFEDMPPSDYKEAVEYLQWFVAGGDLKGSKQGARLADWQQDFPLIVNPVNRVLGYEVRDCEYCHWWTFLSAYYEIGDCLFAQVVAIRKKRANGKKLDKYEREFYNANREIIDLKTKLTSEEESIFEKWGVK